VNPSCHDKAIKKVIVKMFSNTSMTNDISILEKMKFTLSESFEKCPRSANIASAPEMYSCNQAQYSKNRCMITQKKKDKYV
jgi:hypothetical protein